PPAPPLPWFTYALEIVCSRAFLGPASSPPPPLRWVVGPLLLGGACLQIPPSELSSLGLTPDALAVGFALLSLSALARSYSQSRSGGRELLLLPIIDACNHSPSAASSVTADAAGRVALTLGEGCVQPSGEVRISYGTRTEEDLLRNFGIEGGA
ncbi:hypothetical protein TeGR_g10874, partial [Tetraparma gracilis]